MHDEEIKRIILEVYFLFKKIIALTKDNPYERNRVIAQLQADYLKKRYNKTLGQNDDGSK